MARATKKIGKSHLAFEDRLDKVLMNRYAALPIFFIFMFIIYFVSINVVGDGTTGLIEGFISGTLIPAVRAGDVVVSNILDTGVDIIAARDIKAK